MSDLLFLAHRTPFPPDRGDRIRSWHILRHLALQRPVHLIAFGEEGEPVPAELQALCASVRLIPHRRGKWGAGAASLFSGLPVSVEYFIDRAFRAAVEDRLARSAIRTIYAFSSQMAAYLPLDHGLRVLLDLVDCDSEKFEALAQASSPAMAALYRREARLLRAFERQAAARADAVIFVSAPEAAAFKAQCPMVHGRVHIVPNGVDLRYFRPQPLRVLPPKGPANLLFVGQMDYPPNIDAALSFARETMPILRTAGVPLRFQIVGRAPSRAVRALASAPDIEVHGDVPDVRPWLAQAAVVVAPLRIARGVQNKILEAMASARPVVATSQAITGLAVDKNRDIVEADTPQEQADALLDLLADPNKRAALGASARRCVERAYDWRGTYHQLDQLMMVPAQRKAA